MYACAEFERTCKRIDTDCLAHLLELSAEEGIVVDLLLVFRRKLLELRLKGGEIAPHLKHRSQWRA